MPDLEYWILLPLLAASLVDLRVRKIPNILSFPLILSGLIFHLFQGSFLSGLTGFAVGFVWFFVPYLFGWVGAGDVKLMAGAGCWAGGAGSVPLVLASGVFGALWVLVLSFRHKEKQGLWLAAAGGPASVGRELVRSVRAVAEERVPYGATVFLGYALYLLM